MYCVHARAVCRLRKISGVTGRRFPIRDLATGGGLESSYIALHMHLQFTSSTVVLDHFPSLAQASAKKSPCLPSGQSSPHDSHALPRIAEQSARLEILVTYIIYRPRYRPHLSKYITHAQSWKRIARLLTLVPKYRLI